MKEDEIKNIIDKQKNYFNSGATISEKFRISKLKLLYNAIKKYENEINAALKADLGKSGYESFMCEVGLVLSEISYMINNVRKFSKAKTVKTPLAQFASHSYVQPVPRGVCLIMSPWNYPFLLTIDPLADAIAAGNTAVIKPSAYSPNTSKVIKKIIEECFSCEYVAVITGGREENSALLKQKFDFIFFTGSGTVGKEVLKNAAENLIPVVLELGGKSPCIVDKSADLKLAAKRIVFGKFLNCGQTCVAPDYILCESSVCNELLRELEYQIKLQFGENPLKNKNYGKIINSKHFLRLCGLINEKKVVFGGECDENNLKIAPTLMSDIDFCDVVMQQEIFGPLLPVIKFDDFNKVLDELKEKEKPLALYIFSRNKNHINRINKELSFGGGCINDVVIQLATSEMGFGGVGASGMGSYHGKAGFDAFSHYKSMVDKKLWIDLPMRYHPYKNKFYKKLLHMFLR